MNKLSDSQSSTSSTTIDDLDHRLDTLYESFLFSAAMALVSILKELLLPSRDKLPTEKIIINSTIAFALWFTSERARYQSKIRSKELAKRMEAYTEGKQVRLTSTT